MMMAWQDALSRGQQRTGLLRTESDDLVEAAVRKSPGRFVEAGHLDYDLDHTRTRDTQRSWLLAKVPQPVITHALINHSQRHIRAYEC